MVGPEHERPFEEPGAHLRLPLRRRDPRCPVRAHLATFLSTRLAGGHHVGVPAHRRRLVGCTGAERQLHLAFRLFLVLIAELEIFVEQLHDQDGRQIRKKHREDQLKKEKGK